MGRETIVCFVFFLVGLKILIKSSMANQERESRNTQTWKEHQIQARRPHDSTFHCFPTWNFLPCQKPPTLRSLLLKRNIFQSATQRKSFAHGLLQVSLASDVLYPFILPHSHLAWRDKKRLRARLATYYKNHLLAGNEPLQPLPCAVLIIRTYLDFIWWLVQPPLHIYGKYLAVN